MFDRPHALLARAGLQRPYRWATGRIGRHVRDHRSQWSGEASIHADAPGEAVGAVGALAQEAFTARGRTAFPAQLVQRYSNSATEQWRSKWAEEDVSCHWLEDDHIYREAAALLVGEGEVRIWDSSAGSWVNPRQSGGYGSLAAVRIFADGHYGGGDGFACGERRLEPNVWVQLAS